MSMTLIVEEILGYLNSLSSFDILFMSANIILMLLIVSLIYIIKMDNKQLITVEDNTDISLDALEKKLNINATTDIYEENEENRAIISYEELVKTSNIPVIKYKEEETIEGLLVKAIDVNNLIETMDPKPITHPATYSASVSHNAISKEKQEELVKAIEKLNI